jgi:hypothetical protein
LESATLQLSTGWEGFTRVGEKEMIFRPTPIGDPGGEAFQLVFVTISGSGL